VRQKQGGQNLAILGNMSPQYLPLAQRPEVIETLAAWHQTQWGYLNPQRTLDERIEKFQRHLEAGDIPATFVAFDGEKLLGSASLVECDLKHRTDLTPWLASVYVAPEFRGHGVGNGVVQCVEDHARSLGVETLYLFTPDRAPFYARRGWRHFADDRLNDEAITLMSLEL
jgi:N-acetylglutamate synthase-like GNAT family acetyltransferase